jgi:hypothetical protein
MNINLFNEHYASKEGIDVRLGKLPAKSSPRALLFDNFLKKAAEAPPPRAYNFWPKSKAPFPIVSYGNTQHGNCTIASQAVAAMRMERIEQRRTVTFDTDSVIKAYYDLTARLYGGGDTGAYETDALDNWRRPDFSFRDSKGRPHTIDAYTRINHLDHEAIRRAFFVTGGKCIKVCFNLPWAWSRLTSDRGKRWDVPEGTQLTGEWMPGTWGGHSMTAVSNYDADGFWAPHQWNLPDQFVTWRGAAVMMDEVHWVVDSVNSWKKTPAAKLIDFGKLVSAVNEVSSQKI